MILSVDPGAHSGLAIFGGSTPAVSSVKGPTMAYRRAVVGWCAAKAAERGESLTFVVEDQHAEIYKARGRPVVNVKTLLSLTRNAERWVVVAEEFGADIVRVMANVWGGPMLTGHAGSTTKARARSAVAATWPELPRFKGLPDKVKIVKVARLNEHERDAALMGRWHQLHGRS